MTKKDYIGLSNYDKDIQKLSFVRLDSRLKKLSLILDSHKKVDNKLGEESMFVYFQAMLILFRMGEVDSFFCKMNPYRGDYFLSKIKDEVSIRENYLSFFGLDNG